MAQSKITEEVAMHMVETERRNFQHAEDIRRLRELLVYVEENRGSLFTRMMAEPVNLKLAADFLGLTAIGFAVPEVIDSEK